MHAFLHKRSLEPDGQPHHCGGASPRAMVNDLLVGVSSGHVLASHLLSANVEGTGITVLALGRDGLIFCVSVDG